MIYSPTSSPIEVAPRSPINDRSAMSSGGSPPPQPQATWQGNPMTWQGAASTFQGA